MYSFFLMTMIAHKKKEAKPCENQVDFKQAYHDYGENRTFSLWYIVIKLYKCPAPEWSENLKLPEPHKRDPGVT